MKSGRKQMAGRALKGITFALLASMMMYGITRTVTPTYIYGTDGNSITTTFRGFYAMEEDSIDVLLIGSSQIGAGICAQDMYNVAGIRAYALTSNSQPVLTSYYWLKEALQYQSPKVVVFETFQMFSNQDTDESKRRTALDDMRFSAVKWEAIQAACNLDETIVPISYAVTSVRYHTRWKELEENDFIWMNMPVTTETKGVWMYWDMCGDESFVPMTQEDVAGIPAREFDATCAKYLDLMRELCEENGIEFILMKTPTHWQTAEKHNAVQSYADKYGLTFYDFNMEDLYEAIDFDYAQDMGDSNGADYYYLAHANPSGARKMSVFLANQILGRNGVESVYDEQWENSKELNEHSWQDFTMRQVTDLTEYLSLISEERFAVFISVKGDASGLSDEAAAALQSLGLVNDLRGQYGQSYAAIIDGGTVTEVLSDTGIELCGTLRNGAVPWFVTSAGSASGSSASSIIIDGLYYSEDEPGINIVIYDNEIHTVVDSKNFVTVDQ